MWILLIDVDAVGKCSYHAAGGRWIEAVGETELLLREVLVASAYEC